jgi:hypothetical protein
MPSAVVESAFRTRLAGGWTYSRIIDANEGQDTPSDGSAFVLIQYPVVTSSRWALTKRRTEDGTARIVINIPVDAGLPNWLAKADQLAALFRGDNAKDGHVQYFEPSPPIINDDNEDGNYYSLAVIVPYRYQFDAS